MKKQLICIIIATSLLFSATLFRMSRYYAIACDTYSNQGINNRLTRDINSTLTDMLNNNISYHDITDIKYSDNGRISSISIDTSRLNILAGQLTEVIYKCIENAKTDFGVPLGNTLGLNHLSGKGPLIPFEVIPVGSVVYKIESEILTAGINQAVHRVSIRFDTTIKCVAPFHNSQNNISLTIVIAETVIIGDVPNVLFPT